MPRRQQPSGEKQLSINFPLAGLDESRAFQMQRKDTTPSALNVVGFDPVTDRARGGVREGLSKYMSVKAVGSYSIQDINHLITSSVVSSVAIGQFVYSKGTSNGFGIVSSAGAEIANGGVLSSYRMQCSCWDGDNNVYVAMWTAGTAKIYKVSATGVEAWVTTGISTSSSARAVVGMVVIGDYLYVAIKHSSSPVARIYKISVFDGSIYGGTYWKSTTDFSDMQFSSNSHNCLGSVGTLLGVDSENGTTWTFYIINTTDGTLSASASEASVSIASHTGVESDSTSFFYEINSDKIRKISSDGTVAWSVTITTTIGIAFDSVGARVVTTNTATPYIRTYLLTDGTVSTTSTAGSKFFDHIFCDGLGEFILWGSSDASLDIMRLNTGLAAEWGPTTFANADHNGSSVNRGVGLVGTSMLNSRRITPLVVSNGEIRKFTSSGSTAIAGGSAALSTLAHVVFSAQNGGSMFYADGTAYRYYDSISDTVKAWVATAGAMPRDSANIRARLICPWRGRIVLAGLIYDSQNWFMSAVGDPFDWDYAAVDLPPTMAVAGNNSPAGLVGDTINCIYPYSDDMLFIGGDHTIWVLQGDPMAGGQIDQVTDSMGCAWGRPICKGGPDGTIYFFGSRGGVYQMSKGSKPVRISQQIARRLENINMNTSIIRMTYDERRQWLCLLITPLDSTDTTTHYIWEARTNAWWPVEFGNTDHNPKVLHVFDGDDPDDRVILLGSWDGYLRFFDQAATRDDGTNIESYVMFPPLLTADQNELMLQELQAIMDADAEDVTFTVHVGRTAQEAVSAAATFTGTFAAARNYSEYIRRAGHTIFIKIASTDRWAMEQMRAVLEGTGKVRQRGQ